MTSPTANKPSALRVSEVDALAWPEYRRAAPLWSPTASPMVIVVPHPDDESLCVGGLIRQQRLAGADVSVIAVTDGDAAYDPAGDPVLAVHRTEEQNAALDLLGVSPSARRRLGFPDSRVDRFEDALVDVLVDVDPAAALVAPSHLDVHPDHEAIGRAARRAAAMRGSQLIAYFFWAWHHRVAEELDDELVAYELTSDTIDRKAAAISSHRSQTHPSNGHAPVLDEALLEPARWSNEYFVVSRP